VVALLAAALRAFGTFDWARVSGPAIRLAREGVEASALVRRAFEQNRERRVIADCFEVEAGPRRFLFRQPALAATLERLGEEGPGWFYSGPLGDQACAAWQAEGVAVTPEEWRRQPEAAEILAAASHEAGSVRLFAPTLGITGSACLFATYAAAERLGRVALSSDEGPAELASAMARIWQYRFSGGNDFGLVELDRWIDGALAGTDQATPPAQQAAHTAHLNAADGNGLVAALSATHGHAWFGGRWAIPGSGVLMNAGMHGFTQGAMVRRRARLAAVSNMSPTIALGPEGDRVAVGCPGARRIPSNIALVLARHFIGGEALQRSVSAGRLHAEEPGRARYEAGRTSPALIEALRRRFAAVEPQPADDYYGPLSALRVGAGGAVEAALDDREARASQAFA
jgi:gamma-glutamyltranspeptidase/glutathione hydrolase